MYDDHQGWSQVKDNFDVGYTPVARLAESARVGDHTAEYARMIGNLEWRQASEQHMRLREADVRDDFGIILAGNIDLQIRQAYQAATQNWRAVFPAVPATRYRPYPLASIKGFPGTLPYVAEGKGYTETETTDYYEWGQIFKYGEMFTVTREMLRDDDKRAFARLPIDMGNKAAWTINAMVADTLENDDILLVDSNPLFCAEHSNVTATPTELNWSSLKSEIQNFLLQPDIRGEHMRLRPTKLVVGPLQELEARKLMQPTVLPTVNTPDQILPMSNQWLTTGLDLVVLERLSSYDWFLFAGPICPTVEVAFLDNIQTPQLFMQGQDVDLTAVDGIRYKERIECGTYACSKFGGRRITGTA